MTARDKIFGAIRQKLGPRTESVEAIEKAAAELLANPDAARPDFQGVDLVDRFVAKASSERVTAKVSRLESWADIPNAVADYLQTLEYDGPLSLQPDVRLTNLDWSAMPVADRPAPDGAAAVTVAEFGLAETGSVVIRSGANAPVLLNFLPLTHIVVLETNRILPYSEDVWASLGNAGLTRSRLVSLITGTSGTADIEAKNVRGAHGPRYMMIVLVGA